MKEKTYENYTTGRMHIQHERILTIEHEEMGTVYHIPIAGNVGMFFVVTESRGPEDPETGETLMIPILTPARFNADELAIIVSHIE